MKRKYYLKDTKGQTRIFSSFNQLLRYLKLTEEQEIKLAEALGKVAFTGHSEIHYQNKELGIEVDYM